MNCGLNKPRWSKFQFGMRGLLVLTLVTGTSLAWIFDKTLKQRRAVAWVRNVGGNVTYSKDPDQEQQDKKSNSAKPGS